MRLAIAAISLALAGSAHAQPGAKQPSSAPFVDLMTFGLGDVVFEKFGHAALCLRYREPERDATCFNFGVTDFGEGAPMIWSFLRGTQEFWVEPLSYAGMLTFYQTEDRDIFVQTLPLTDEQARRLEGNLWASLSGPDSRYHYDFFFNNCSTRLRDVIDVATGGRLAIGGDAEYPSTFRQLGYRGLSGLPPLIVLADFIAGRQVENHPSRVEAMFHPEILRIEVEHRLGAAPRQIYHRKGEPFPLEGGTGGRLVMIALGVLFALPIAIARFRDRVRLGLAVGYAAILAYVLLQIMPALWSASALSILVPVAFVAGFAGAFHPRRGETLAITWATIELALLGLIVWGLVAVSPIAMLRWNEVALIVAPIDVVLPFLGPSKRRIYARVRLAIVVLASLLCAIGVLQQPLWVPILVVFMPLALVAFDLPRPARAP